MCLQSPAHSRSPNNEIGVMRSRANWSGHCILIVQGLLSRAVPVWVVLRGAGACTLAFATWPCCSKLACWPAQQLLLVVLLGLASSEALPTQALATQLQHSPWQPKRDLMPQDGSGSWVPLGMTGRKQPIECAFAVPTALQLVNNPAMQIAGGRR